MKELTLLFIDDQIGSSTSHQRALVARFDELNQRVGLDFRFCSGQMRSATVVVNDVGLCLDFVAAACEFGSPLLLLDLNFDSGSLNEYGFPAGRDGDLVFGEAIYQAVHARFPSLPVIFVTSKPQSESNFPEVAYLNKESLGSDAFVRCVLQANLLRVDLVRSMVGVPDTHVFASSSMGQCYSNAHLHATSRGSILVRGESGTGKEYLADFIHRSSGRTGRFIAIDVGTTPMALAEAEWFGIEKGTATGVEKRVGKFELANGGTLFLDEIADVDPVLQAKLLRVLETKEFCRVGGREPVAADFKLVCATSRDIAAMVVNGTFREDLFYRIADVTILLPPLRERPEDIRLLANQIVAAACSELGIGNVTLSAEAERYLEGLPLRGNIRELRGLLNRVMAGVSSHAVVQRSSLEQYTQKWPLPDIGRENTQDREYVPGTLATIVGLPHLLPDTDQVATVEALRGAAPKFDSWVLRASTRLVRDALLASRNPVTGRFNRQQAAQLLAGSDRLVGQEPLRLLNRMLQRRVSRPLTQQDCEELVNELPQGVAR